MDTRLATGKPTPAPLTCVPWETIDTTVAVDYHVHTSYTDGTASVRQMADAAASSGIRDLVFTDHVRHTSTYVPSYAAEIRSLQCPGLNAHAGIESKILGLDGSLDCTEEIASICNVIVGSVHSVPPQVYGKIKWWDQLDTHTAVELEFELALAIVAKSRAHILGHPMGMVVACCDVQPLDELHDLACACREFDKAFELNTRYCPAPELWIDIVRSAGCKVSIGSDAHAVSEPGKSFEVFTGKRLCTV